MPNLISELKRRNVFRVALLYVVGSWVILQVADVLVGIMGLPDWTLRFILLILLLGLPVAIAFSWIYELTPEGLKRDADVEPDPARNAESGRKINVIVAILLTIAIGLFIVDRVSPKGRSVEPQQATKSEPARSGSSIASEPASQPPPRSIAVLPFENMSGAEENAYFSDGLAESLLNLLARLPDVRVAARTSSFQFEGQKRDIREIGELLDVAHVLEGSVQRAGDRIRVTAQLIDTRDGFHRWSGTFDRLLDDVFAVQDEIASSVADALEVSLLGTVAGQSVGTDNIQAYDLYLQARDLLNERTGEAADEALALLDRAISLDPDYLDAMVAKAEAMQATLADGSAAFKDVVPRIHALLERVLELDPDHPYGNRVMGRFMTGAGSATFAQPYLEKALDGNPNDAEAWEALAFNTLVMGPEPRALDYIDRAIALDPLDLETRIGRANILAAFARFEEATAELDRIEDKSAEFPQLWRSRYWIYFEMGAYPASMKANLRYRALNPGSASATHFAGLLLAIMGAEDEARRLFQPLILSQPARSADDLAWACLWMGNLRCAREAADIYEANDTGLPTSGRADALVSFHEGRFEAARPVYLEALEIHREEADQDAILEELIVLAKIDLALGDTDSSLQRLAEAETIVDEWLAANFRRREALRHRAEIAGIRNDAETVAQALRAYREAGGVGQLGIPHYHYYDNVRDDPAVQAELKRLAERQAEQREKVLSVMESWSANGREDSE